MASDTRAWWRTGETRLAALVASIPDAEFDGATLLPGWSRRVLLGHLARNADALGHLLRWARTGVESPMYSSGEQREADIRSSATQSAAALRADVAAAAERLRGDAEELSDEQWEAPVRTAQGRPVPAAEVPWMRCREVWVHAVDLDAGFTFADVPPQVTAALIDDVLMMWERRGEPVDLSLQATDTGQRWRAGGAGRELAAPLAELAAVLTGRAAAATGWPPLPGWL